MVASNAVDGKDLGHHSQGSCTHTSGSSKNWFVVDLGKTLTVTGVAVSNRLNCCSKWKNTFLGTTFKREDHWHMHF